MPRLLIIEDDAVDRELLKSALTTEHSSAFEFAEESTGADGLLRCREFHPDCLLLDLNLPDMDGLEVLTRLSQDADAPPIVVITAVRSERIAVTAMKSGAADYIAKDALFPEGLFHSVENAMEKHQLRLELDRRRWELEERNAALAAALKREQAANALAQENRERYRMLAEAIPQVVWTANLPAGEMDHVSPKWQEATGLPVASALGCGWLGAVHPDDLDRVSTAWREGIRCGALFEIECRLVAPGQGYRWNLLRAAPQIQDGAVLRWFGTFTDIEDRRRTEQAMLQRQKLASTGLLAGGVAHDFNNLLVGILGGIGYALEVLPPANEARSMLETALAASERAALLIRQMLAYAGKGSFIIEDVNLTKLVHSTCTLVRASIPRMVQLNVQTSASTPVIEADSSQVQQIIMNLVINAAEAIGDDAPGIVTVRTGAEMVYAANSADELEPGLYAALEVVDTGCGMDEELQGHIFDPFFTTKFTGRGLGLAAVQGIVRSAKGDIRVRSAPGQGTTFRVLLRAKIVDAGLPAPEVGSEVPQGAGTILVIDDEEIVRLTAAFTLERGGYSVRTVSSGAAAIAAVKENPFLSGDSREGLRRPPGTRHERVYLCVVTIGSPAGQP